MHFLVAANPLDLREPDDLFRDQCLALAADGHGISTLSVEELQSGGFRIRGPLPRGATVAYRGWMLGAPDYERLVGFVIDRGATPLTTLDEYLLCHHLPNWYPLLSEFTAETAVFPVTADLASELRGLGWGKVFLKDYVKSLKTSVGSTVVQPDHAALVVREMEKFRGEVEGGICVRRFEAFRPGSEVRYFVLRGVPHAPRDSVPPLVEECARRIASPFFTVDVAVRDDGALRVVELGDGQVSDLVGWSADTFARMWKTAG